MLNEVTVQTFAGIFYIRPIRNPLISPDVKSLYDVVYSLTNNLDGKKYVGQTRRTLEERFYIKKLSCKHPHEYNGTDGGRRSRSPKAKIEKQLDPRKEFFLKMIGAKITYYRTLREADLKRLKNFLKRYLTKSFFFF